MFTIFCIHELLDPSLKSYAPGDKDDDKLIVEIGCADNPFITANNCLLIDILPEKLIEAKKIIQQKNPNANVEMLDFNLFNQELPSKYNGITEYVFIKCFAWSTGSYLIMNNEKNMKIKLRKTFKLIQDIFMTLINCRILLKTDGIVDVRYTSYFYHIYIAKYLGFEVIKKENNDHFKLKKTNNMRNFGLNDVQKLDSNTLKQILPYLLFDTMGDHPNKGKPVKIPIPSEF